MRSVGRHSYWFVADQADTGSYNDDVLRRRRATAPHQWHRQNLAYTYSLDESTKT
jgi:hypothetical protein